MSVVASSEYVVHKANSFGICLVIIASAPSLVHCCACTRGGGTQLPMTELSPVSAQEMVHSQRLMAFWCSFRRVLDGRAAGPLRLRALLRNQGPRRDEDLCDLVLFGLWKFIAVGARPYFALFVFRPTRMSPHAYARWCSVVVPP